MQLKMTNEALEIRTHHHLLDAVTYCVSTSHLLILFLLIKQLQNPIWWNAFCTHMMMLMMMKDNQNAKIWYMQCDTFIVASADSIFIFTFYVKTHKDCNTTHTHISDWKGGLNACVFKTHKSRISSNFKMHL